MKLDLTDFLLLLIVGYLSTLGAMLTWTLIVKSQVSDTLTAASNTPTGRLLGLLG